MATAQEQETEGLESGVHMKGPLGTLRNIWGEFEMRGSQGTDVVEKGTIIMTLALPQVGIVSYISDFFLIKKANKSCYKMQSLVVSFL